ncbi:GNAT family N-acetyltransferase [Streptomyces sp. NPDC002785]|uniref:GNAT family N-acetyltransferase n=1 Tax=Streptomyces sp. NPDC002785 TaxID=3154543 RepID=UPI0033178B1C
MPRSGKPTATSSRSVFLCRTTVTSRTSRTSHSLLVSPTRNYHFQTDRICRDSRDELRFGSEGGTGALVALIGGEVAGVAGYRPDGRALIGGGARDGLSAYGTVRGPPRVALLALMERRGAPGELLMDGIAVDAGPRGAGIGGLLLREVAAVAADAAGAPPPPDPTPAAQHDRRTPACHVQAGVLLHPPAR